MMDRYIVEERLERLDLEQLEHFIKNILKISSKEKIDFELLPREYKGMLRHYSKLSHNDKMVFLEYIKNFVKSNLNNSAENVSEMLEKSKAMVKEDFLKAGPSSLKKADICAYIEKLAHSEIEALTNYLELLANNVSFSIDETPRRIQGALKLYKKLKAEERINFLETIREKIVMTNLGENNKSLYSLVSIITDEKRKNIFEYLNKADSLSVEYQALFIDEIYRDITKNYSKIIKENRINKCNHCFDYWKDCSYTLEEETRIDLQLTRVPVEHIRFERKCKKCGYVEVVDYIPKVVAEKQQITAKKNKIKKLRRELNKVEKELEDTTKEIASMNREIRRF